MNQFMLWTVFICYFLVLLLCYIICHLTHTAQFQQLIVLLCVGFIQMLAGLILFKANSWESFKELKGVIALVPTLMDLKGNVEISMASRLSTLANTSNQMKTMTSMVQMVKQNIVLVQCQVTIVSVLAVITTTLYLVLSSDYQVTFSNVMLLSAIALSTSSITCTLLGTVMIFIISFLSKSGHDPDDVATSLAASFGDLITICMLVLFTSLFYNLENDSKNLASNITWIITLIILLIFPICLWFSLNNSSTRNTLFYSCPALLLSTIISLVSGFIFETYTDKYQQMALVMPMFNGFVGNSISIICNLIITTFQRINLSGDSTESVKWLVTLKDIFYNYEYNPKVSTTCRSHLVYAIVPCQFGYLLALRLINSDYIEITALYVTLYLMFSVILLVLMITLTCNMIHIAYRLRMDPCETVIAFTTSLTDFFGSLLLSIFYRILTAASDDNAQLKTNKDS